MSVLLTNLLATKLVLPDADASGNTLVFAPNGETGYTKTVAKATTSILSAVANGQLSQSGTFDNSIILGPFTGTGAAQVIPHGLGSVPTYFGAFPLMVPDTGYGGGSAKPFDCTQISGVDATNITLTVTVGIEFGILVIG